MIRFPNPPQLSIVNQLSGATYEFVRACDVSAEPSSVAGIVSICNEPDVYRWLFRDTLAGRPYTEANALAWLQWSQAGWSSGTHFVFALLDHEHRIAAACDIKSRDPTAEIGYWASQRHRGIMTNAVKAMCALAADAGFLELFARTRKGNLASQAVLQRAGFERRPEDDSGYDRYALLLGSRGDGK